MKWLLIKQSCYYSFYLLGEKNINALNIFYLLVDQNTNTIIDDLRDPNLRSPREVLSFFFLAYITQGVLLDSTLSCRSTRQSVLQYNTVYLARRQEKSIHGFGGTDLNVVVRCRTLLFLLWKDDVVLLMISSTLVNTLDCST